MSTPTPIAAFRQSFPCLSTLATVVPLLFALALPAASVAAMPIADDEAPIHYEVSFADAGQHFIDVDVHVPVGSDTECELMMATWTPGSYLIREYARNIDQISAVDADGGALDIKKTTKNRWVVDCSKTDKVVVSYRLYCREMSVRTNFVDRDFAILNGAPTFVTWAEHLDRPHDVDFKLPKGWKRSVTALGLREGAGSNRYRATDFDQLVDSPILVGNPEVHTFNVSGKEHWLVNLGGNGLWDGEKASRDVAKIVAAQHAMWKTIPYERYMFLNVIAESGGGLEHDASTLMMTSRWTFRRAEDYQRWLGLVSHEFFHTWNVRTLRHKNLVEYDYENENYFPSLWIAEGITSYYDDLMLARSGSVSAASYLRSLGRQIDSVESTPGRQVQSLRDSSHDAWIKYYRRDEHSKNVQISYYVKGAVVGFLLDMEIRRATDGKKSLDDVMRQVYRKYSNDRGYTEAEFRKVASRVAGKNLDEWFARAVDSTDELDYSAAREWLGMGFKNDIDPDSEASGEKEKEAKAVASIGRPWWGVSTREERGKLLVSSVTDRSPGFESGINVDDEIIAVNRFRVGSSNLDRVFAQFGVGEEVIVTLSRRGELRDLPVLLTSKPEGRTGFSKLKKVSDEQQLHIDQWIGAPSKEDKKTSSEN